MLLFMILIGAAYAIFIGFIFAILLHFVSKMFGVSESTPTKAFSVVLPTALICYVLAGMIDGYIFQLRSEPAAIIVYALPGFIIFHFLNKHVYKTGIGKNALIYATVVLVIGVVYFIFDKLS